jgi:GAF domain-containing protein
MTVDSFDSLNISENSISALRELLRKMMVVTAQMLQVDLAIAHSYGEQELDKISEIYNKNDSNENFSWLEATIIPITNPIAISDLSSQVPSLQARGITASLIIPCQQQGELLAIFGFYHRQRQHSWTAEEIELAQTMAAATALSITHLQSSATAYALAQREALLNTISRWKSLNNQSI